jgi:phosphoribosyl 1,2-cyclic phosphodiesterase
MQVRFWGVRGSIPSPSTSDDITARIEEALWRLGSDSNPPDLHDRSAIARWISALPPNVRGTIGGNTPCVEMRTAAGDLFIIDLGSGLRLLGNELMKQEFGQGQGRAHLFLSHFHWDHIQGWPFFKPAYVPGNRLDLYTRHDDLKARLRVQQQTPFFPPTAWNDMRACITFTELGDEPLVLCDGRVQVSTIELDHPSRAYAYRFEADGKIFVYASDSAYKHLDRAAMQRYIDFYQDADLLIFDAQFALAEVDEKYTWGHSSGIVGVELACQAGAKNLVLFHHDPGANDALLEQMLQVSEQYAAVVPYADKCRVLLAREDMMMEP